jgi:hypothetical protein
VHFDLKFRPWRYLLTHSELELRSFGSPDNSYYVSIRFHNVVAMTLRTVYRPLTLAVANRKQSEELANLSGLTERQWERAKCLALKSTGSDGLVACVGYTIREYSYE